MRTAILMTCGAFATLAACERGGGGATERATERATSGGPGAERAAPAATPPPVPAGATRITGEQYVVDVVPPAACAAGAACAVELRLHALGGFKVNKDYPHKFVVADGAAAPAAPGKLALDGAHAGTMTLAFSPAAAGPVRVAGVFKLSVCSDDNCVIAEPEIALEVPAS
jgi:hypothetical protein